MTHNVMMEQGFFPCKLIFFVGADSIDVLCQSTSIVTCENCNLTVRNSNVNCAKYFSP